MKTWLETCDREHISCQRRRDPTFMPVRLLKVGSLEEPTLRLLPDGQVATNVRYIALSHCWGRSQPFVLNETNHEALQSSIEESRMPRTFQDVVRLARLLEIQHVWVDSLCIKQGHQYDWEVQSRQMGRVYENAYVTIAASNSPGDSHGFLNTRPTASVFRGSTEICGAHKGLWLRQRLEPWHDQISSFIEAEPLTSRGWTFQERTLSRRTIFFCSRQLVWQCREACETEDGQSGPGTNQIALKDGVWYNMVYHYFPCLLTRSTDKLPALSGVADLFMSTNPDVYLAGHWLHDLPHSLLWHCQGGQWSTLGRIIGSYTPSWSWASRNGAISWIWMSSRDDSIPIAQLVDHSVQPLSEANPYGEVRSGGFIVLSTAICQVKNVGGLNGTLDAEFLAGELVVGEGTFRGGLAMFDDPEYSQLSPVAFAFIEAHILNFDLGRSYDGILVTPRDGEKDCYERIGAVRSLEVSSHEFERIEIRRITLK